MRNSPKLVNGNKLWHNVMGVVILLLFCEFSVPEYYPISLKYNVPWLVCVPDFAKI